MKWLVAFLALFIGTAHAQTITPAAGGYKMLYATGQAVGNGADTTVDTLQTFTLPAGQLANIGDVIHVVANGTMASSTDSKTATITFGGIAVSTTQTVSTAGITKWNMELWVIKTGSNSQTRLTAVVLGGSANGGTSSGTISVTDTNQIVVSVTGQNATNSVANSVVCQGVIIEYLHQ